MYPQARHQGALKDLQKNIRLDQRDRGLPVMSMMLLTVVCRWAADLRWMDISQLSTYPDCPPGYTRWQPVLGSGGHLGRGQGQGVHSSLHDQDHQESGGRVCGCCVHGWSVYGLLPHHHRGGTSYILLYMSNSQFRQVPQERVLQLF
jgi:hypothetical protein